MGSPHIRVGADRVVSPPHRTCRSASDSAPRRVGHRRHAIALTRERTRTDTVSQHFPGFRTPVEVRGRDPIEARDRRQPLCAHPGRMGRHRPRASGEEGPSAMIPRPVRLRPSGEPGRDARGSSRIGKARRSCCPAATASSRSSSCASPSRPSSWTSATSPGSTASSRPTTTSSSAPGRRTGRSTRRRSSATRYPLLA